MSSLLKFIQISKKIVLEAFAAIHVAGSATKTKKIKFFLCVDGRYISHRTFLTQLCETDILAHGSERVQKVIMNLDSSKASGPDSISLVVLKNCEPEISCILDEIFNMCLKKSCFPDYWIVSLVVSVFKNVNERSTA